MSIDREPNSEPSGDEAGEPVTADTDKMTSQSLSSSVHPDVAAKSPAADDGSPAGQGAAAQGSDDQSQDAKPGAAEDQLDFQRADLAEQDSSDVTDEGISEGTDLDRESLAQDDEEEGEEAESEPEDENIEPLELVQEPGPDEELSTQWYILKVQVNREDSIRDALQRRVKIEGLDRYFKEIVVPTEDVAEFTKTGKRRIIKRKLYPGYIMVNMHINDDTWFLVRETPGIGDFTGSAGKPTPMNPRDVERILNLGKTAEEGDTHVKTAIPFKQGDRVRVKDGYFQNFEGDVESVDEANGRVTVMINIFGRSTPVELEHWQIEAV